MMKSVLLTFVLLFLWVSTAQNCFAQKVSNVKAELDKINRQIIISYDLEATLNKYDKYVIELYLSKDSGATFDKERLVYVSGEIGKGKIPAEDKKITWFYLNEDPDFDGKNVVFKIKARLDEEAYEKRLSTQINQKAPIYSLFVSGWGDYKVRSGKNYWWIGLTSYSLVGSGIFLHIRSQDTYSRYEQATSIAQGDSFLNTSKNQATASKILLATGIGLWITDIVSVWIKEKQNKKEYNRLMEKRLKPKLRTSLLLDWDTEQPFNSPQIGLTLKF